MAKKFSTEFKQQSVDYALSNAHLSLAEISKYLGIGNSTLDKWIRQINPSKTSKRELTAEQQKIILTDSRLIQMLLVSKSRQAMIMIRMNGKLQRKNNLML